MQPFSTKNMRFPARPLSADDVQSLIKACGPGPCGRRNAALITLLWRSGLRISEALSLSEGDIDMQAGTVLVLHGKGNRSRLVGFDPQALRALGRWTEVRGAWFGDAKPACFFCTLTGRDIDPSYIRHMLKRLAKRAGLKGRVHAHGLRHTHAYELQSEGFPLVDIADQLGHANVATTDTYLRHLNPAERIGRIRKRTA